MTTFDKLLEAQWTMNQTLEDEVSWMAEIEQSILKWAS